MTNTTRILELWQDYLALHGLKREQCKFVPGDGLTAFVHGLPPIGAFTQIKQQGGLYWVRLGVSDMFNKEITRGHFDGVQTRWAMNSEGEIKEGDRLVAKAQSLIDAHNISLLPELVESLSRVLSFAKPTNAIENADIVDAKELVKWIK